MESKELVQHFVKFNKLLGLKITDQLSADLKVAFSISEFAGNLQDYQACLSVVPKFSFIGQFNYQNRGVLFSADSRIVSLLTDRMFGGNGMVEEQKDTHFTFSEQFLGKEVVGIVEEYFNQKSCNVEFGRFDYHVDHTHLFFFDEQVMFIDMKCTIHGNDVGSMVLVYPLQFVKQEQEKWMPDE